MKKCLSILFAIAIVMIAVLPVSAAVELVDPSVKIHDGAGLLTADERASLEARAQAIVDRLGIDIAIVTVIDNSGMSAEAYADDVYDYSGFGVGPGDDGMLLFINMATREFHVSTYNKAQRLFSDVDLMRLEDKFLPALSDGRYYAAFGSFLSASESHLEGQVLSLRERISTGGLLAFSLLIGVAVGGIVTGILVALHKRSLAAPPGADQYLAGDGFVVTHRVDRFVNTHTSRTAIPKSSSSSGGGSTHRSSSGRSHGGRGGRF